MGIMADKHDPMDEKYWKKRIEQSIKMIRKDKFITPKHEEDFIKKLRKI
jgi:hypothetical protein